MSSYIGDGESELWRNELIDSDGEYELWRNEFIDKDRLSELWGHDLIHLRIQSAL